MYTYIPIYIHINMLHILHTFISVLMSASYTVPYLTPPVVPYPTCSTRPRGADTPSR